MIIRQVLSRVYDSMHISFHQISNDIDILKTCGRGWLLNIDQTNDVLMVKVLQQLNLTHDSLRIYQILKRIRHFLDRYLILWRVIVSWTYYSVCTMSNLFDVFKFILDDEGGTWADEGGMTLELFLFYGFFYGLFLLLLWGRRLLHLLFAGRFCFLNFVLHLL